MKKTQKKILDYTVNTSTTCNTHISSTSTESPTINTTPSASTSTTFSTIETCPKVCETPTISRPIETCTNDKQLPRTPPPPPPPTTTTTTATTTRKSSYEVHEAFQLSPVIQFKGNKYS